MPKAKAEKADSKSKAAARAAERAKLRPKRSDVPNEAKLKLSVDKNPRRAGTGPHAHFEKYKDGMTVGDLLGEQIGGEWVHLQADIERGYVEIVAPAKAA